MLNYIKGDPSISFLNSNVFFHLKIQPIFIRITLTKMHHTPQSIILILFLLVSVSSGGSDYQIIDHICQHCHCSFNFRLINCIRSKSSFLNVNTNLNDADMKIGHHQANVEQLFIDLDVLKFNLHLDHNSFKGVTGF